MKKNRCLIASVAMLMVGCGGGGSGGNKPVTSVQDMDQTPTIQEPARPALLPFPVGEQNAQQAGIDQASSRIQDLPAVGESGEIRIRAGTLSDGAGRNTVVAYLSEAALDERVSRFASAPTVRVVATATARERAIVVDTVAAINHSLPPALRMQIGADLAASGAFADDTIEIEFLSCADYGRCGQAAASTAVSISRSAQGEQTARRAQVAFARGTVSHGNNRLARILMAHELLHALGVDNHVSSRFASISQAGDHYSYATRSILTPLDREALSALYGHLDPGDAPGSLGPWANSSMHIAGNGQHANFGVALRNGYAEPWAHGPAPAMALARNGALSGSVTWTGALLGLTPGASAVAGDAEIGVDLATLSGTADFTSLETWAAHAVPGAAGTGAQWLDGDLGYTIAVRGNTFRETSGDAGRLIGIFTGRNHEGAAGTLERTDLTAAFGAQR